METWSEMISPRTEMNLRIILALACTFTTSTHAVAQANAAPRAAGTVIRDCRACPAMIALPAGSFAMGSSAEEKSWAASHGGSMDAVADEAPQRQVSLPRFALGKYDVTRGEYAAFARETGYPAGDGCGRGRAIFKWEKDPKLTWENPGHAQTDRDPVVCVSWQDARAYIAWLNRKAHRGGAASVSGPYRLPSEAEWEYAARAGTTTKFYWGDDDAVAPVHAWFNANSGCEKVEGLFCDHGQTHPVGAKPPNAFGLYDMAGNVLAVDRGLLRQQLRRHPRRRARERRPFERPEGDGRSGQLPPSRSWRVVDVSGVAAASGHPRTQSCRLPR